MFLKELYRKVPATENGKPVKKSQLELLAEAVVKNGIRGTSSKASKLGIGLPSTARGARGGLGRGAGATLNGKAFNWQPVKRGPVQGQSVARAMVGDAVTRGPPASGMVLKFVEQIEAREAARIVASASEPLDFSRVQSLTF